LAYAQGAPDRGEAISPVLGLWAEKEPEAAAAWVKQLPDGGFRNTAITATTIEMALRNPALAFDLVQNYYSGPRADRGLPNLIFTAWAETDPTTAIAKASELSQPLERQNALYSIAATWASKDPQSALAWAESLPDEERTVAIGNVIFKWTENDPHAVRAWFQQLPDGLIKQMAADNLPRSLAAVDPPAAAQFVAQLPPGSEQTRAAEEVARAWANSDPGSAAEWAKAFPSGEPRDVVLRDVIFRWSQSDPRAASEWLQNLSAESFSNENILKASIQSVARGLLELDRKAGEDWLEKTSLPDELKRRLLGKP